MSREAIAQKSGSTGFVIKLTIVAALGGLLFGYDTAVIAGVIDLIKIKFDLSPAMEGWAASCAIWGCIVGSSTAGYLSDRFGRKTILIVTALLFGISSIGAAVPSSLTEFVIFRIIGGVGIGAASMLSPLYISEIAPANIRGKLVSVYQLAIVIGINLIYFVNLKIAALGELEWKVETGWRYMIASGLLPSLLFLVLLFIVPESPRWLIKKNRSDEAIDTLERVNGKDEAQAVVQEVKESLGHEEGTVGELFKPGLRKAMIVGAVLALFSQITGINAIIYYGPKIFASAGATGDGPLLFTVIIGCINTVFTFIAIGFIDKLGRKTLLLWGVAGMIISLIGTAYCFLTGAGAVWLMAFIFIYIASFAASLGPIPWVIISEIFPTKTRGIAMSFATTILWLGVVLITQFTPIMLDETTWGGTSARAAAFTFILFAVNGVILWLFTKIRIPETKQKTLEEIEASWTK
ncbi:arabinose-proton symporter [Mucilaginibacter hurinus]|uniref:Arabinose-proton symporter n=1 Tax=Mucilaginibacter hurinus TaxID=2201324 RepID=A0A367GMK2_9SPHI|nr:sugar porter family MFS transporter [Mucilaginibacter hurinus]RCH54258.1 arabinose-proton symporter [Mucilaginibacter hurinus]